MKDQAGDEKPRRRGGLSRLLSLLKDGETFDMRWTAMPQGHRALSEAPRTNDLVLKHFHRPVELALLPFQPGDDTTPLQRVLQVPPTAVGHDPGVPVWIRPHALEPYADVIVGDTEVGSTTLAPAAWKALIVEAERGVYADGALFWGSRSPANGGHAYELRCYLPRHLAS